MSKHGDVEIDMKIEDEGGLRHTAESLDSESKAPLINRSTTGTKVVESKNILPGASGQSYSTPSNGSVMLSPNAATHFV